MRRTRFFDKVSLVLVHVAGADPCRRDFLDVLHLAVERVRERLERPVPLLGPVALLAVGALLGVALLGVFGRGIVHCVVPLLVLLAVRAQRLDARDGEPFVLVERVSHLAFVGTALSPATLASLDVLCIRFDPSVGSFSARGLASPFL